MKNFPLFGAMIVLLFGAVFIFNVSPKSSNTNDETLRAYANEALAFSFEYSPDYVAIEPDGGASPELAVSLYTAGDWEDFSKSNEPREGPTGITVEVFENQSGESAVAWVARNERSNFNLGPKEYSERLVAHEPAVLYRWSGLYEGRSAVFVVGDRVYMLSVTYLTPEDGILEEFEQILDSFSVIQEKAAE